MDRQECLSYQLGLWWVLADTKRAGALALLAIEKENAGCTEATRRLHSTYCTSYRSKRSFLTPVKCSLLSEERASMVQKYTPPGSGIP